MITKAQAGYRQAPDNAPERCGTCDMYRANQTCTLVEGKISPTAVCIHWAPRQKEKAPRP